MNIKLFKLILFIFYFLEGFCEPGYRKCVPKQYQLRSDISCVCNATYCDDFPSLGELRPDTAVIYVSSKSGMRFQRLKMFFQNAHKKKLKINYIKNKFSKFPVNIKSNVKIDVNQQFQRITGFGGAFTDAVGFNLKRLSPGAKENLLNSYYGKNGIGYSTGRVPIASCDFSSRIYSYCDSQNDFSLVNFSLANEDFELKIPYIKTALSLTNLSLIASPWAPPAWMKSSGKMTGGGVLKGTVNGKYYKTWAKYFLRFFEEYKKQNIIFWGLTLQNEPSTGEFKNFPWQTLYLSVEMQRFVSKIFGPLLKSHDVTKHLKLIMHDDQRYFLPYHANVILQDRNAAQYIDGIGVHWYGDFFSSANRLLKTHNMHPDKFILPTEACNGYTPFFLGPVFGDWYRAESYANSIIEDLENWAVGWTDWNICLDEEGGPNFAKNFVDAPIIVNSTTDEFYKQPMYYALGHFSKFIRPDSVRLGIKINIFGLISKPQLSGTSFLNPNGKIVLVILNRHSKLSYTITVNKNKNKSLTFTVEPNSIITAVWKYDN